MATVIAGEDFTIECVFTRRATPPIICAMRWRRRKPLFTGDHVMGWSTSVIAPPDGNMGDYMRSLEKLIARDDEILYPTHGSPIPEPAPLLRAYLTHRRMREAQIAGHAWRAATPISPRMVARLYAGLAARACSRRPALTVRAHLEHMIDAGPGDAGWRTLSD